MNERNQLLIPLIIFCLLGCLSPLSCLRSVAHDRTVPPPILDNSRRAPGKLVGKINNSYISECSGMDTSPTQKDLLWVINDGGNGPYIFAMGLNGQDRGRVRVRNITNRDWEGLDAFIWEGESYLLVADIGDNKRQYTSNRLYIIREPNLADYSSGKSISADISWQIEFTYPDDEAHNAESVAVDKANGSVLILTKGDSPPIVYKVPLFPPDAESDPIIAKKLAAAPCIPPPSPEDLTRPFGKLCSQPTAMDISANGQRIVVLTYTHAYLFKRDANQTWDEALSGSPQLLILPSPYQHPKFRQREAICFSSDDHNIFVTSEGVGADIYCLGLN